MSVKRAIIGIFATCGLTAAGLSFQGSARVPCDIQFDLAVKILAFDRKLPDRVGDELVFCVLYQSDLPASLQVKAEMERAISFSPIKKVGNIPLRTAAVDLSRTTRWEKELKDAGADIVYLAPLKDASLEKIVALCRRLKLTSVASLSEYPPKGAAVGFEPSGDKPIIVINLTAAREEGADFNSRLLRMAKVIR